MYRAVTGKPPVDSPGRVHAVLQGEDSLVPASDAAAGEFSRGFLAAIDAALQFEPRNRPQNIEAWREQLSHPQLEVDHDVETVVADPPALAVPRHPKPRANLWIGLVAVIALGVALASWWPSLKESRREPSGIEPIPEEASADQAAMSEATPLTQEEPAGEAVTLSDQLSQQARAAQEIEQAQRQAEETRLAKEAAERAEIQPMLEEEKTRLAELEKKRVETEQAAREAEQAQAEAGRLAEQEGLALQKQLEEARRKAEENARREAEERARLAELEAKQKAEQRLTEEQAARAAEEKRLAEIERLLAAAATDVELLRLTTPAGSNALEKYREVLSLDPENKTALRGLENIVDRYLQLAERASEAGKLVRPQLFSPRPTWCSPEHPPSPQREKLW